MMRLIHRFILGMKQYGDVIVPLLFISLVGIFFYRTILFGKLPVPSDALVGLYHPYRDATAREYPNGIPFKNFLITDPVRQQIPWRKSVISAFNNGELPLWNASSFSGMPLVSNIQTGLFYPFNILFLFFSFEMAWTAIIISQPLLAGLFLYWWLRRKRLDRASSVFGAICFAFSGFSLAWLTWGTMLSTWLWTPLSMLAIDAIGANSSKGKRILWTTVCIASLLSSFFAGHIQIFIYSVALLLAYTLWTHRTIRNVRLFTTYAVISVSFLAGAAFQLTRIIEWLPGASRLIQGSTWKTEGFFIPVWHLIQFIVPDFFGNPATLNYWGTWNYGEMVGYIGIVGLVFAFLGISALGTFWVSVIAVALLFSVASPISAVPYQLHTFLVSSLQPTRLLVVIDFALSILAAYGFSRVSKGTLKKSTTITLCIVGFCFLILWVVVSTPSMFGLLPDQMAIAKRNLVVPSFVFICTVVLLVISMRLSGKIKQAMKYAVPLGFLILVLIDLFRFGWKFTPFTDSVYFFPTTNIISFLQKQPKPFRIMTTDDRIMPPNVNQFYGIESISGYDPIHALRYEEFIAAMERGKPDISPPFGFDRIMVPKNIESPLVALLNVRYVLSFDRLNDANLKPIVSEGKTILYEKTDSRPRAYLVERAVYKKTKQDIINQLYDSTFDPKTEAIVEHPVSVLNFPLEVSEIVDIRLYTDDEIVMHVNVQKPRLLVIGNIYDPHWGAFIDNVKTGIYRTDYLFIGLVVPVGTHTVVLKYN